MNQFSIMFCAVLIMLGLVAVVPDTNSTSTAENSDAVKAKAAKPIALLTTNVPPPVSRVPVYILPEAIVVQTPYGPVLFAERLDVERLSRLFPARLVTNIVFYNSQ